jgi:hypothetical protein
MVRTRYQSTMCGLTLHPSRRCGSSPPAARVLWATAPPQLLGTGEKRGMLLLVALSFFLEEREALHRVMRVGDALSVP